MKLQLGQIADWIHAEGEFDSTVEAVGYSIDSRTIAVGELFFAVKGERVDGHDYVEAALTDGAVAAVVSMRWLKPATVEETKLLRVPDEDQDCVLHSMQRLANRVRRTWGKRVIAVTGSAGKTTTKECIALVLSAKFNVLKTEGNLNNHFGVPLTLLCLEPDHEVAVLEMDDVVLLEILKARGLLPKFDANVDVFVLIEDETLRAPSLKLIQELRAAGFAVEYPLTPAKPDKQFKRAQELKAAFTAKVESESYVRIRNLKSRDEIVAGFADAANHLR